MELKDSTNLSLSCNGTCDLQRRDARGKIEITDFHDKFVTIFGLPVPKNSAFNIRSIMSLPWSASFNLKANMSVEFLQDYFVSSSPNFPGLVARVEEPVVNVKYLLPNSEGLLDLSGRFRVRPDVFVSFRRTSVSIKNAVDFEAGFRIASRNARHVFRPLPLRTPSTGVCGIRHLWRGRVSPILRNVSGSSDSMPHLGFDAKEYFLDDVGLTNPFLICAMPA